MKTKFIRKGTRLDFECTIHPSVGIWEKVDFDEDFFLCEISSPYSCPEDCPCGGDRGSNSLTLTAKRSGVTKITFIHNFRGEIEQDITTYFIL